MGETINLDEVLSGNTGQYTTGFACSEAQNSPGGADRSRTLVIAPQDAGGSIICTYTNTLITTNLTLRKAWVNGVASDTAALNLTSNSSGSDTNTSTASGGTETDDVFTATLTALAGDTVSLNEVLGVSNTGVYSTSFECGNSVNMETGSGTSWSLVISPSDANIVCTFTNTLQTRSLTLRKAWVNGVLSDTAALTASSNNSGSASDTSVADGTVGTQTDDANTAVLATALVGDTINLSELLTGNVGSYTTVLGCTGTGGQQPTGSGTSHSLLITSAATTIVCTYTNTLITKSLTLRKEWVNGVNSDTALLTMSGSISGSPGSATDTSIATGSSFIDNANTALLTALAGETVNLTEVLGGSGSYSTTFACTGNNGVGPTGSNLSRFLVVDAQAGAIVCTYTNTELTGGLTLRKEWVGGVVSDTALLTLSGSVNGTDNDTSTATGGNQLDNTDVANLTISDGESITLTEVLGGSGSYATSFACSGNFNAPGGSATNRTLTIDSSDIANGVICTFTNTIQNINLTLRKSWVNGVASDSALLTLSGSVNGTASDTSVSTGFAGTETDNANTAILPVQAGESVDLSETFGSNIGTYTPVIACTGNTGNGAVTPGSGGQAHALVVGASATDIVCTYTNTVQTAILILRKEWVDGVASDTAALSLSGANSGSDGATSTAMGGAGSEVDGGNQASISALVGETISLSEVLGVGNSGLYETTFACSNSTNQPSGSGRFHSLSIVGDDNNDTIVCTYTNSVIAINLAKTVFSMVENPNGTFTVIYEVTATNTGSGTGTYDIDDDFTPGTNVTLVGGQATIIYYSGPGSNGTVMATFSDGGKPVDDQSLAPGTPDVWRITAVFNIDAANAEAEDLDCEDSDDFVTTTGTANGVLGSVTDDDLGDNRACAPLPQINLAKTVVSMVENPNGTFTVIYEVTATNNGDGAGIYDIDDDFTPGTNVTLVGGQAAIVYHSGDGPMLGTVNNPFNDPGKAADNITLLAGSNPDVWRITAVFNIDAANAVAEDLDCENSDDFATLTGTANGVTGSSTDIDLTDNRACAPLPQINLAKTVFSMEENPNGTFTVIYEVTATNNGLGDGIYDIDDTFTEGNNVTLQDFPTIVYHSGPGPNGAPTINSPFNSGDTGVVDNAFLAFGDEEVWRITAVFMIDAANAEAGDLDCTDSDNPATNTGTANGVLGSSTDIDLTDNRACAPLPQINLAKTVKDVQDNNDSTFTVQYTVTATNNGDGDGIYDIDDTFTPGPNITLVGQGTIVYATGPGVDPGATVKSPFDNGDKIVDD